MPLLRLSLPIVLAVNFIGGPNKMWTVGACAYIEAQYPALWIIEANATYRGWFVGGNQSGDRINAAIVAARVAGRGALGRFFASLARWARGRIHRGATARRAHPTCRRPSPALVDRRPRPDESSRTSTDSHP